MMGMNSYCAKWIIFGQFTPCFLSESAFDFAVLSIESGDNIGSMLPWQQLPKIVAHMLIPCHNIIDNQFILLHMFSSFLLSTITIIYAP